ncbi:hypothetical protein EJ06DRAFT_362701 [Trichodelitschia bisporula]|uniref:Uncharacterized protein n=1 Tax=Trichodelitschia bisporula TaxID=703511 RepID=A0A6G1I0I2_9PEZI|nr:hypothetical protein EJ06DRAFT_362701 [Trichodelitschia bisporula]
MLSPVLDVPSMAFYGSTTYKPAPRPRPSPSPPLAPKQSHSRRRPQPSQPPPWPCRTVNCHGKSLLPVRMPPGTRLMRPTLQVCGLVYGCTPCPRPRPVWPRIDR